MDKPTYEIDIWQLVLQLWNNKKQLVIYCIIGAIVGIVVAFSIPKEYSCEVVVAPEKNTASGNPLAGMGGLASMMGVNIGSGGSNGINENIYPDILKSSPFIAEFENIEVDYKGEQIIFFDYLTKEQKYPWWKSVINFPGTIIAWFSSSDKAKEGVFGDVNGKDITRPTKYQYYYERSFKQRVTLTQDKKTNVIAINVKMQDPEVATSIAEYVISHLERYVVNYQTNKVSADLNQTKKTLEEARISFYTADSLYANAQDRNQNLTSNRASLKINRLRDERNLSYSVYEQLANKVEVLKIKLQEETPLMTIIEPARVPLQPVAPKKATIIIAFFVLGGFVVAGKVLYKYVFNNNSKPAQTEQIQ